MWMRLTAWLVLVGAVSAARQEAAPAFDVVSVKPAAGSALQVAVSTIGFQNGHFTGINQSVRRLLVHAYEWPAARIAGGPGWIDTDRFDIGARAAAVTPDAHVRLMVRSLLRDRFQLSVHTEMREATVYTLARVRADRLGPRLVPSTLDCSNGGPPFDPPQKGQSVADLPRRCTMATFSDRRSTTYRAAVPISELAHTLSARLSTAVTDQTGLTGRYDIDLRFAPDSLSRAEPSEWPVLMRAIQEQLGLRLQSSKAPVEFLVIDRIERPSEN
jgi:uncharacterized protein (TIGR03435 family)